MPTLMSPWEATAEADRTSLQASSLKGKDTLIGMSLLDHKLLENAVRTTMRQPCEHHKRKMFIDEAVGRPLCDEAVGRPLCDEAVERPLADEAVW